MTEGFRKLFKVCLRNIKASELTKELFTEGREIEINVEIIEALVCLSFREKDYGNTVLS